MDNSLIRSLSYVIWLPISQTQMYFTSSELKLKYRKTYIQVSKLQYNEYIT